MIKITHEFDSNENIYAEIENQGVCVYTSGDGEIELSDNACLPGEYTIDLTIEDLFELIKIAMRSQARKAVLKMKK